MLATPAKYYKTAFENIQYHLIDSGSLQFNSIRTKNLIKIQIKIEKNNKKISNLTCIGNI